MTRFILILCSFMIVVSSYAQESSSSGVQYDFEYQGLDRLFLIPGIDQIKIDLVVDCTQHFAWDAEKDFRREGVTDERYEWWLDQQKGTRSQVYNLSMQLKDGVYSQECWASAGAIFQADHHLYVDVNFNDLSTYHEPLHDSDSSELQMLEQYRRSFDPSDPGTMKGLKIIATAPATLSELLGISDNLPLFIQGNPVEKSSYTVSDKEYINWINTKNGGSLARFEIEGSDLVYAVFYVRSSPEVREITYHEYTTDENSGIRHPTKLTIKRYSKQTIESIENAAPFSEIVITITSISSNF